jgi:hypothetical protein
MLPSQNLSWAELSSQAVSLLANVAVCDRQGLTKKAGGDEPPARWGYFTSALQSSPKG